MTHAAARRWKPTVWAFFGATVACMLGALATDLSPWYYALRKPWWQPPDWLFGPAWTIIFTLIAIAGSLAWQYAPNLLKRRRMLVLLAINLALNVTWSALFFRLQRPDLALLDIGLLWLSIVSFIWTVWPFARSAALLFLPYLAWVSFAATLNLTILRLNAANAGF